MSCHSGRSAEKKKEREEGSEEQRRNKDGTGRATEGGRGLHEQKVGKIQREKICADWRASVSLEKDLTSHRCPALSCLILKIIPQLMRRTMTKKNTKAI